MEIMINYLVRHGIFFFFVIKKSLQFESIDLIAPVKIASMRVSPRNDQRINDVCSSSLNQSVWCDSPLASSVIVLIIGSPTKVTFNY